MGQKILIDTNIAIGYIGNRFESESMDRLDLVFNKEYHLSIINKIELLGYPGLDKNEEYKFNLLINNSVLHGISDKIVNKTIEIRKKHKIKLPDALIAATCLVNGLAILTSNNHDFEIIRELKVIVPNSF
jgi:predicted nucleic acid-binding protein